MATGKSVSNNPLMRSISTESGASSRRSSSFSCISTDDNSDDTMDRTNEEKRKAKKKSHTLFRKAHSETKDKNAVGKHQRDSSKLKRRLRNFFKTKRKSDHFNVSFSHTDDIDSCDTVDTERHVQQKGIQDNTQPDFINDFSQRHSKIGDNTSNGLTVESCENDELRLITNKKEEEMNEKQKYRLDNSLKSVSKKESELSRRDEDFLRKENDLLSNAIKTLNEMAAVLSDIVHTPLYVEISECKTVQIGTGSEDVQQNLQQVRKMLDSICAKYDDIKHTTEATLNSVKKLQNESSGHKKQLHKLAEFLESNLRRHTSAEEPEHLTKSTNNTQNQVPSCDRCNPASPKPSGNIWGPSTVHDFVVSSHVTIDKNVKQVMADVQLIKNSLLSEHQSTYM
ncbi:uncharacterized protein LOC132562544 [Ylistrum balloti]|uniref:uncharacterized protein LOC132562544 n=1 Tax=Ylistrum balloti TaxID=509963 RepID=UPI002905EC51|nr:uncharacterized protein LOC132562544 [Ylistrum balloti]